jgi:acyl-homoserine-lactone acylase
LHLAIPGKVDAMGATPAGLPFVAIGHNADVAWTHTVNSSVHFTFHQLTLDPRDATRYVVDGRSRPMSATFVEVKRRLPNGAIRTTQHPVWSSELGPIIVMPGAFGWTARTAFAFGDANADNTRFAQTWWAMDQAKSLAALRAAVEDTLGIPWIHTIAVDAGGTTYVGDVTPVPNIPDDMGCIPAGFGPLAATGVVVLDGSKSHCGWQVAPGTPTPGIVPAAQLPTLVRTDFVQNSNDSAWLFNPAAPLTGYPPIVSRDGIAQNARTRAALTHLTGELAAGRRFSLRSLQDFAFSNRAFQAASLVGDLRSLCAASTGSDLTTPCGVIDRWDGTTNLESVGWPVYRAWRTALDAATTAKRIDYARVPFDPADPVGTPRGLWIADPVVAAAARGALIEAMKALAASGIDPHLPWGATWRAVPRSTAATRSTTSSTAGRSTGGSSPTSAPRWSWQSRSRPARPWHKAC